MMVPWEVFAKGVGCSALFLAFCLGLLLGVGVAWFDCASTPYITRRTALLYGLQNAQAHCADKDRKPPVDCEHFSLINLNEDHVGWYMTLLSADRRRTVSMFIGRRGEYDSAGETDVDDPDNLPSQDLIDRGAAAPSQAMRTIEESHYR